MKKKKKKYESNITVPLPNVSPEGKLKGKLETNNLSNLILRSNLEPYIDKNGKTIDVCEIINNGSPIKYQQGEPCNNFYSGFCDNVYNIRKNKDKYTGNVINLPQDTDNYWANDCNCYNNMFVRNQNLKKTYANPYVRSAQCFDSYNNSRPNNGIRAYIDPSQVDPSVNIVDCSTLINVADNDLGGDISMDDIEQNIRCDAKFNGDGTTNINEQINVDDTGYSPANDSVDNNAGSGIGDDLVKPPPYSFDPDQDSTNSNTGGGVSSGTGSGGSGQGSGGGGNGSGSSGAGSGNGSAPGSGDNGSGSGSSLGSGPGSGGSGSGSGMGSGGSGIGSGSGSGSGLDIDNQSVSKLRPESEAGYKNFWQKNYKMIIVILVAMVVFIFFLVFLANRTKKSQIDRY